MDDRINRFLERTADVLAGRPGLLIFVAIGLVLINFLLQVFPGQGYWIIDSNLCLHIGLVIGFIGILLIRPLG
ncbi:MAG: hypothetical protein JSW55_19605 [Chloroflexota bacterium]|nr:MAG: hypothetical protein JSW55_19605 [Chloroflexota bacterium]